MSVRREAIYFSSGPAKSQIFSLYQAPLQDKEVSEGVLICPPAPFETRRSHRALRNLAQNLTKRGYHVLRIDYQGTGGSEGDFRDWSIDLWQSNIQGALTQLRETHGVQRVSVVGLRLGATLAWRALQGKSIKRFVLWDPIFEGAEYLSDLQATHKQLVERENDRPPFARADGRDQLLGFAITKPWTDALKDLRLEFPASARGVIIQSHNAVKGRPVGLFKCVDVDDDQQWSNPLVLHIQSFAHPSITAIEQALEGRV